MSEKDPRKAHRRPPTGSGSSLDEEPQFHLPKEPPRPIEEIRPDPEPVVRADYKPPRRDPPREDFAAPREFEVLQDASGGPSPVSSGERLAHPSGPGLDVWKGAHFVSAEEAAKAAPAAKVRVLTTGVFDLIHLGHVRMLEAARKLGDELVVVVARDETVRRQKHDPINPEQVRRDIVAALRPVDRALLGRHGDIYQIVKEIRPHIIALGHDQPFEAAEVQRRCAELGVEVRVERLPQFEEDLDATRKIIDRIGERIRRNENYMRGPARHG